MHNNVLMFVSLELVFKLKVLCFIFPVIGLQEGEQFAQDNGMFFLETSAKTAQNINELFHEIGNFQNYYLKIKSGSVTTLPKDSRVITREIYCFKH